MTHIYSPLKHNIPEYPLKRNSLTNKEITFQSRSCYKFPAHVVQECCSLAINFNKSTCVQIKGTNQILTAIFVKLRLRIDSTICRCFVWRYPPAPPHAISCYRAVVLARLTLLTYCLLFCWHARLRHPLSCFTSHFLYQFQLDW